MEEGIEVSDFLFDFADRAELKKFFRFAEQLRASTMSITNSMAEGSGSFSDREFASFLNISRRSLFECVNILYTYERRKIIIIAERAKLIHKLKPVNKRITNFRKTLKSLGLRA